MALYKFKSGDYIKHKSKTRQAVFRVIRHKYRKYTLKCIEDSDGVFIRGEESVAPRVIIEMLYNLCDKPGHPLTSIFK